MKAIFLGLLTVLLLAAAPLSAQTNQIIQELKANAEKGNAKAQYNLGICYHEGQGVAKDYVQAVNWFRKAAEQGFAAAQFALGSEYRKGEGVSKNIAETVKWFRKAAEQNSAEAQFNLGGCYVMGEGVKKPLPFHAYPMPWI